MGNFQEKRNWALAWTFFFSDDNYKIMKLTTKNSYYFTKHWNIYKIVIFSTLLLKNHQFFKLKKLYILIKTNKYFVLTLSISDDLDQ